MPRLHIYDRRERRLVLAADGMFAAAAALARPFRSRRPVASPRRILLLRLERIGDLVMVLPAIADVRRAKREEEREGRAGVVGAVEPQPRADHLGHLLADVEAEPRAADTARGGGVDLEEALEDALLRVRRYPVALVADRDHHAVQRGLSLDRHPGVWRRVFQGVLHQVGEDLVDLGLIGLDLGEVGRESDVEGVAVSPRPELVHHVRHEHWELDGRHGERLDVGLEARHDEELLDQAPETLALAVGGLKESPTLLPVQLGRQLKHRLDVALDRRERRPELVRDDGHEVVLGPVQLCHMREGAPQPVDETNVLQCDRGTPVDGRDGDDQEWDEP